MSRKAEAADFGLDELKTALRFDHLTMTVAACKCRACWKWKTEPAYRRFWRVRTPPEVADNIEAAQ